MRDSQGKIPDRNLTGRRRQSAGPRKVDGAEAEVIQPGLVFPFNRP
jgi:hypothetical protein